MSAASCCCRAIRALLIVVLLQSLLAGSSDRIRQAPPSLRGATPLEPRRGNLAAPCDAWLQFHHGRAGGSRREVLSSDPILEGWNVVLGSEFVDGLGLTILRRHGFGFWPHWRASYATKCSALNVVGFRVLRPVAADSPAFRRSASTSSAMAFALRTASAFVAPYASAPTGSMAAIQRPSTSFSTSTDSFTG